VLLLSKVDHHAFAADHTQRLLLPCCLSKLKLPYRVWLQVPDRVSADDAAQTPMYSVEFDQQHCLTTLG
jgi:hypothetical protein